MLPLRKYQRRAIDNTYEAERQGVRRGLIVLPTGTGKTVVFSHMLLERAGQGRGLVLVHREELAEQARQKLAIIAPNLSTGIVKAEQDEVDADVVIASIPTVHQDERLARLLQSGKESPFATVIADEAHHAPAPSWTKTLRAVGAWNPYGPLTVGFTATPERDNGKTLGVWERVVAFMSIREAIYGDGQGEEGGYLVPILPAVVVETNIDLDRARSSKGESGYRDGDIGQQMENSGAIEQIADAIVKNAPERKGISFTPTVATAHLLAAALRARGISAEALDGTTPKDERRAILRRLKTGETMHVTNCSVLTEGFDEPSVDLVVIARPTRFHGLYVQMVGRGPRKHPGKKNLMVIDVVGASTRHELITNVDLGLDMDEPGKKPDGESTPLECGYCGTSTCDIPSHRCALCHRRLPAGLIRDGHLRHDNCGTRGPGKVDLFGSSRLRWLPLPGDAWCLGAGDREIVLMVPNGAESWKLAAYQGGRIEVLHEELPSDWAMNIGEDRAKAFGKVAERKAAWLARPVSDRQKGRLLREGLPEQKLSLVRTQGEAADLITRISGRRALKRLGVPL